jgi:hypothetical protein
VQEPARLIAGLAALTSKTSVCPPLGTSAALSCASVFSTSPAAANPHSPVPTTLAPPLIGDGVPQLVSVVPPLTGIVTLLSRIEARTVNEPAPATATPPAPDDERLPAIVTRSSVVVAGNWPDCDEIPPPSPKAMLPPTVESRTVSAAGPPWPMFRMPPPSPLESPSVRSLLSMRLC